MTQTIQEPSSTISLDEVLKVFANMPDALKIEVLHYAEYLLNKNVEKIDIEVDSTPKKSLAGCMKGTFILPLPNDFDEPLNEFAGVYVMGSILLDTHAFIWLSENDSNLPNSVLKIIDSTENVFVSAISFWEIAIKLNIGKISLQQDFDMIESKFNNTSFAEDLGMR